jgi:sensor c-di-GMP phosphodiesterase-like protein
MIELADIREGLQREEFFLEYLPTMSLGELRCIGAEALIRWRRADGVVLPPGDFIPIAENTPLAGLLTYRVVELITQELGSWLEANREAYVGINAPPEILGRGGLSYAATKSGLSRYASQLMLEITERGLPDALGVESLNRGGHMGARVALDDVTFVRPANLAVLARCDFDAIKLDKSLIDQITPDSPNPDWLAPVAALAASSKLQVIAEGVDSQHQVDVLRSARLHAAQGFYFSRPLPAEKFIAFHRDHPGVDRANGPTSAPG